MDSYINSVKKSLHKYYGDNVKLFPSSRRDKKFMVLNSENKKIHFGQKGYEDYHSSQYDEAKRDRFLKRNKRWSNAEKWTPAHLSYWVLWNV